MQKHPEGFKTPVNFVKMVVPSAHASQAFIVHSSIHDEKHW